jgi:hypothetical protein
MGTFSDTFLKSSGTGQNTNNNQQPVEAGRAFATQFGIQSNYPQYQQQVQQPIQQPVVQQPQQDQNVFQKAGSAIGGAFNNVKNSLTSFGNNVMEKGITGVVADAIIPESKQQPPEVIAQNEKNYLTQITPADELTYKVMDSTTSALFQRLNDMSASGAAIDALMFGTENLNPYSLKQLQDANYLDENGKVKKGKLGIEMAKTLMDISIFFPEVFLPLNAVTKLATGGKAVPVFGKAVSIAEVVDGVVIAGTYNTLYTPNLEKIFSDPEVRSEAGKNFAIGAGVGTVFSIPLAYIKAPKAIKTMSKAEVAEAKQLYITLAKKYHPDSLQMGNSEAFKTIKGQYDKGNIEWLRRLNKANPSEAEKLLNIKFDPIVKDRAVKLLGDGTKTEAVATKPIVEKTVKLEVYRGEGGKVQNILKDKGAGAMFGEGKYYADSEKYASKYGKVTKEVLELKPNEILKLDTDAKLDAYIKKAMQEFPDIEGSNAISKLATKEGYKVITGFDTVNVLDVPASPKTSVKTDVTIPKGEELVTGKESVTLYRGVNADRLAMDTTTSKKGVTFYTTDRATALDYANAQEDDRIIALNKSKDEWSKALTAERDMKAREVLSNKILDANKKIQVIQKEINKNPELKQVKESRGQVIEAKNTLQNPLVINAKGQTFDAVNKQAIEQAQKEGRDGVVINNVVDAVSKNNLKPITTVLVFDKPKTIKVQKKIVTPTKTVEKKTIIQKPKAIKADKKQINSDLENKTKEYVSYTPEVSQVFGKSNAYDLTNLMNKPALLYGGIDRSMFTDAYILIRDKKIADAINIKIIQTIKKKEIAKLIKKGESTDKAMSIVEKDIEAKKRTLSKEFPKINTILPTNKDVLSYELKPVAVTSSGLVLSDSKYGLLVDADKFQYIKNLFPNAKLGFTGEAKPLIFFNAKNEIVAYLMPRSSKNFDFTKFNKMIKETATPKKSIIRKKAKVEVSAKPKQSIIDKRENLTSDLENEARKYKSAELDYIRNIEKAPKMGNRFGQDIEPAGKYINLMEKGQSYIPEGWEVGKVKFNNPLIIDWGGGYGDKTNWKNVLSERYGRKTGKQLSQAIVNDGYDGIITLDKGKPSEVVQLTDIKNTDPLIQEARKYKSAEEFVKAQDKLFHGTTYDWKGKFKEKTTYLTPEKKFAEDIADNQVENIIEKFETETAPNGKSYYPTVKELYTKTGIKLFDPTNPKDLEWLRNNLPDKVAVTTYYGGIIETTKDDALKSITKDKHSWTSYEGGLSDIIKKGGYDGLIAKEKGYPSVAIFEPNKNLYTKSQLTDIWNKANVKAGIVGTTKNTDPLMAEARKYKSAEEFVRGQGKDTLSDVAKIKSEYIKGLDKVRQGIGEMGAKIPKSRIKERTVAIEGQLKVIDRYEKEASQLTDIWNKANKQKTITKRKPTGNTDMGFNPKNLENPFSPKAKAEMDKVIKQSDIAKKLSDKLNVPIRMGKYNRPVLGLYKTRPKVVRLKSGGLQTIFHEVGHYLDDTIEFSKYIELNEAKALMAEYGYTYEGKPDKQRSEGFAEYLRFKMTGQQAKIDKFAPIFDRYFESKISTLPDIKSVIDEATAGFKRWAEQPSTAKVLSQISIGKASQPSIKERAVTGIHDIYTAMLDDIHPLNEFSKLAKKRIGNVPAEKDPYILARNLRGWTGKADLFFNKGTFGKQFYKLNNKGKYVMDFKGKSYSEIMKPLDTPEKLDDFRVYIVSQRIVNDLEPRGIKTGIDIKDAKQALEELDKKYPDFEQIAKDRREYKDQLMNYAEESGLIGKDGLKKMRELNKYHVPFYRVMEEAQAGFLGKRKIGGNVSSPIKKIKGSEREIIDPFESDIKDTLAIINASERNSIGIAMANLAKQDFELGRLFEQVDKPMQGVKVNAKEVMDKVTKQLGEDIKMPEELADIAVTIFRPTYARGNNMLNVNMGDKQLVFEVDPDLYRALQGLDVEDAGLLMRLISLPAKVLRAGATLTPDFSLRNPLRDQFTAMVYSKYGFTPGIDLLRGMFQLFKKDNIYDLWKASGGDHASMVSLDRNYLQKSFKEIMATKKAKTLEYLKNPLKPLQILSELGEAGTRLGEMRNALAKGASPIEAGLASREITLDFARIGAKSRAMNLITAFWNANLQGTDTMIRSFKNRPYQTLLKTLLGITLPSILLYMANKDDPRWKEIPTWQKNLFWIILTPDHIYRIPKPFELGMIFGSAPERLLEYIEEKDPKVFKELQQSILDGFTPGYLPTALLPIIENITNYSFFTGRSIVSRGQENLPAEAQAGTYTSEVAKIVGEALGYSPSKVDNLVQGYTGGLGKYTTQALDEILKGTGVRNAPVAPAKTLEDTPVLKAFMIRKPVGTNSESVNRVYEMYGETSKQLNMVKKLAKEGNIEEAKKYAKEHPEVVHANLLAGVVNSYSEMNKAIDAIRRTDKLSAEEKRDKIAQIAELQTEIAQKALAKIKELDNE